MPQPKRTRQTRIIEDSWEELDNSRAATINPPLYRGSTVCFDSYEDMVAASRGEYTGISYGTDRLPIQRQLEEALRRMENGEVTRSFQSGIAAIQTALMAFVKGGDHVLVCDNAYGPGQRFCRKVLSKFGVETSFFAPDCGGEIELLIRPETSVILMESPGSITFELQDIPAIVDIARRRNIVTMMDATWATPLFLRPIELGVDLSIHSVTKYISGYSDVLAGAVTVNERCAEIFDNFYKTLEIYTPAEECYLSLRGLHSLATRLRQHQQSALEIARWLENHPLVDQVLHPALPSHPEHQIFLRDFSGSSGLFSFTMKQEYSEEQLADFINSLQLFGLGYSWGGYKSLLTAAKVRRSTPCRYDGKTIVRLNIGLEESAELIDDLEAGLGRLA